jgi:hypothetical protein
MTVYYDSTVPGLLPAVTWNDTTLELDMPAIHPSRIVHGSIWGIIREVTGNYTITTDDYQIVVQDTLNLLLPTLDDAYSGGYGQESHIKLLVDAPCTVSVSGGGADIDGDSVKVLSRWDNLYVQAMDSLYIVK